MNVVAATFTLLLLSLLPCLAEKEKVSDYKINMVNWGQPLHAVDANSKDDFDPASLKDRVVVVEEFGVKTPACLERLKDLGRLAKKADKEKLKVTFVAIHRQRDVPDPQVAKAVEKSRAEIVIRKNGFLPASIGGMPHAAIFLPNGDMLWHGDSTERDFDKAYKEAIESLKD